MAGSETFLPLDGLGFRGWEMVPVSWAADGSCRTVVRWGARGFEVSFRAGDTGHLFAQVMAHIQAVEALDAATPRDADDAPRPWPPAPVPQLPPSGLPLFAAAEPGR